MVRISLTWERFVSLDDISDFMNRNIQDFYNRWTKAYDIFSSNPVINNWREEAAESLNLKPGSTVIDIGCGTGANMPFLSDQVGSDGTVICVDLSEDPLRMAQKRANNETLHNVDFLRADANNMPLTTADAYFASFSIAMLPNTLQTVKYWCNALDKGSKICILDVVKAQENEIINKPLEIFTGMSVPTDFNNKMELSISGDALDQLDNKIRNVRRYLGSNHEILEENRRLGGCIISICVEIQ